MTERVRKRIGEILIEEGLLSKENLEEALNHQKKEGGLIGQLLLRLGYISEPQLIAALGKQLSIPYLPLENYSLNTEALENFDEEFLRRNVMTVFDQDEKHVFLAMADPLNESAIAEAVKRSQRKPQIFISTSSEILNTLDLVFHARAGSQTLKKAG